MIKAIIFDFFGVLANEGTVSFAKTHYANDQDKLAETSRLQDELNLAVISYDEYAQNLARLGGVDKAIAMRYLEKHQPNADLLNYIRLELKPKYKIGILSNAGDDWTGEILGAKDLALFDDAVLSYREGMIKPQPEIYQMSAKNLGARPNECVFADDKSIYCDGAREVGMQAIWYRDFEQFRTELEKILAAGADN